MKAEVYELKPQGFKAALEIAACYVEVDGQLLLLECPPQNQNLVNWEFLLAS